MYNTIRSMAGVQHYPSNRDCAQLSMHPIYLRGRHQHSRQTQVTTPGRLFFPHRCCYPGCTEGSPARSHATNSSPVNAAWSERQSNHDQHHHGRGSPTYAPHPRSLETRKGLEQPPRVWHCAPRERVVDCAPSMPRSCTYNVPWVLLGDPARLACCRASLWRRGLAFQFPGVACRHDMVRWCTLVDVGGIAYAPHRGDRPVSSTAWRSPSSLSQG